MPDFFELIQNHVMTPRTTSARAPWLVPAAGLALATVLVGLLGTSQVVVAGPAGPLFTGAMGHRVFAAADNGVVATTAAGPGNVVDLAQAGIYDPATYSWAVVFDYASITVEAGAEVTFLNHPSRAPVIWHATGDITIDGQVNLRGENGRRWDEDHGYAQPGPGGFRGGRNSFRSATGNSAGYGPGAGFLQVPIGDPWRRGGSGSHATLGPHDPYHNGAPGPTYGGASVFPLVGGSGGGAGQVTPNHGTGGGGAAGGAILIASEATLSLTSTAVVDARGGNGGLGEWNSHANHGGGGSGGSVRLVGEAISIQGAAVHASGGITPHLNWVAGDGRIRIEANAATNPDNYQVSGTLVPEPDVSIVVHEIVSPIPPTLQIVGYNTDPVGNPGVWSDISTQTDPSAPGGGPRAQLSPPGFADVQLPGSGIVALQVLADHVAFGETVEARVTPASGQAFYITSTPLVQTGTGMKSMAELEVDFSAGVSAIQLRVDFED